MAFAVRLCVTWIWHLFPQFTQCGVCLNQQLKSFGAKLKERNNFFRKTSKVQSHELKEVLYSNLLQANLVRTSTHLEKNTKMQNWGLLWMQNEIDIVLFWGLFFILVLFPGGAAEVKRKNSGSRWDDKNSGWLYLWIRNRYSYFENMTFLFVIYHRVCSFCRY